MEMMGKFRLIKCQLGSGRMGEVCLSRDTLLDRPVRGGCGRNDESLQATQTAYLDEARAAAHPAPKRRGGLPHQEIDGRRFIAGELVTGVGLDKLPRPMP